MYSEAWNWPATTAVVSLLCLGWFLLGVLVGRRATAAAGRRIGGNRRPRREEPLRGVPDGQPVEIYVGNLSYDMTEADLRELFSRAGRVVSVRLIENKFSGKSKGYCFIEMADRAAALNAIKTLSGKEVQGRKIVVSEAKSKAR